MALEDRPLLRLRITLRLAIIFFYVRCFERSQAFRAFRFHAFLIPVAILLYTLAYDVPRIRIRRWFLHRRKSVE